MNTAKKIIALISILGLLIPNLTFGNSTNSKSVTLEIYEQEDPEIATMVTVKFDTIEAGQEQTINVTLKNIDTKNIDINLTHETANEYGSLEPFIIDLPIQQTIPPNETISFDITFRPHTYSHYGSMVDLNEQPSLILNLEGEAPEHYDNEHYKVGYNYDYYKNRITAISEKYKISEKQILKANNAEDEADFRDKSWILIRKDEIGIDLKGTNNQPPAALLPPDPKEKQAEYPAVCADLGNSKLHNEFGQLPVEAGIIECKHDTAEYKLDQPINRAEAAKILYTLKLFSIRPDLTAEEREVIKNTGNTPANISRNYPGFTYQPGRFSDVQPSDWFANYIETLNQWHIISGDEFNNTYRPGDPLNNAESIKLIISSFLSGGKLDLQGPVQYGTDLISQQESAQYFQKKYATNLNNIKQGFTNIDDQAWYITYLAEADANGLSANQTKYTSNNSTPIIYDSTTREDFILWAMRIYTSEFKKLADKRQRLLPNDLNKQFTMGRDNLSIKNGTFVITLGDIIHAFDFRYTIPANDTNFNDKRYFFEGDEMQLNYYQSPSGELDPQKLERTFEKYSIRNQKGEKLNAQEILKNWEQEVSGGNCSGFPALAASVFNNYAQIEHYTSSNYNKLFQIQKNDSELRNLNTENPSQSTYLINMADQIRIAWLKSEFAGSPVNDTDHLSPKQLVQAYQEFFDRNPGIDYSKGFHTIPYTNGYKLASGGGHAILFYSYKKEGNKHFFGTYDSNFPNVDNLYFVVTDDGSTHWTIEYLAEDKAGNFSNPYKNNSDPNGWKVNSKSSQPVSINKIDYLGNTRHNIKSSWLISQP